MPETQIKFACRIGDRGTRARWLGSLSGAPIVRGTFTFKIKATDSSTGTGPYSSSQTYSLLVKKAGPTHGRHL